MSKRKIFLPLFWVLISFGAIAQSQDFQLWTEASVEKKLTKKISILAIEELRFNNNAGSFDKWHNTLGGQFTLNKHVRFKVMYRYTVNNTLKRGYQNSNRFIVDGSLKYKLKRFILGYRLRYQIDYINVDYLKTDAQFLRNRFSLKYNIRKTPLTPFISYEFYYNLKSMYGNTIERNRLTGGFDYGFTDFFNARIYYRYQKTGGNYIDAQNVYVLGVSLGFEF